MRRPGNLLKFASNYVALQQYKTGFFDLGVADHCDDFLTGNYTVIPSSKKITITGIKNNT